MAAQPKYISVKDSILEQWTFQKEIVINKNCFTNYRDLHGDIKGIYKAFFIFLNFISYFQLFWILVFGAQSFEYYCSGYGLAQLSLVNFLLKTVCTSKPRFLFYHLALLLPLLLLWHVSVMLVPSKTKSWLEKYVCFSETIFSPF